MCGRAYRTFTDEELEIRYQSRRPAHLRIDPNWNFSPTQISPIVRVHDGERWVETSKWGIQPFRPRAGDKRPLAPINARADTAFEKPMFKHSLLNRRCIVPVSGFYEWKKCDDETKRPFAIRLKDDPIMSMAGIYSVLDLGGGELLDTFAILTTEANEKMVDIHDRMPVILDRRDEERWLDPESTPETIRALLKPCAPERLETFEVSKLVNSPRNNSPELLRPAPGS
jgi:putative SOS response-associated peptidase YedK